MVTHAGGCHCGRIRFEVLAPATLDTAGYRASSQQKFDEKMAAGFESEFPPEFRALINSYFDQIRKESRP